MPIGARIRAAETLVKRKTGHLEKAQATLTSCQEAVDKAEAAAKEAADAAEARRLEAEEANAHLDELRRTQLNLDVEEKTTAKRQSPSAVDPIDSARKYFAADDHASEIFEKAYERVAAMATQRPGDGGLGSGGPAGTPGDGDDGSIPRPPPGKKPRPGEPGQGGACPAAQPGGA